MTIAATELEQGPPPPLDGNIAPAFELARAGGSTVRLRGYRGRRGVALWFLHDAGCPGCRETMQAIAPLYGDYAEADAEPLAIVPATLEAADQLRRDLALPFPVLADAERRVFQRYGVAGAALMLTDRYGVPALWCVTGAASHALPNQEYVLRELTYLSHTCSAGCSTPVWAAEQV